MTAKFYKMPEDKTDWGYNYTKVTEEVKKLRDTKAKVVRPKPKPKPKPNKKDLLKKFGLNPDRNIFDEILKRHKK
jgi:hypothetical protein